MLSHVRMFFHKDGPSRYMFHLDLTRCMTRCIRRAGLPIWYTEGFNPHAYMTFALPLSLGAAGYYEIMDIRFVEDMPLSEAVKRLNDALPEGITVWKAAEPVKKPTAIVSARWEIALEDDALSAVELSDALNKFFAMGEILVEKKTKAKKLTTFDVKPQIIEWNVAGGESTKLMLLLPAGCINNINPSIILNAFYALIGHEATHVFIKRTEVLDDKGDLFV